MSHAPALRAWDDELIVDSFAGGGGASLGIEMALGRSPDIAINHDAEAIALHSANHPHSRHYSEDVWQVDPIEATGGKPVGLMWLSPDCKHHSKAKGGKPLNKKVRGLAWVAVRWAKAVRPRVICLENVEEFQDWGPLYPSNHPDPKLRDRPIPEKKGLTFRVFCGRLRALGYDVQTRELRGCDYGAPTIRKRLFLIARCDGQPIVWPKPTHSKRDPEMWAATCIDWSIPCPSIFERKRPLAINTERRIARGVRKYVLTSAKPFIVGLGGRQGQSPERPVDRPYQTITTKADSAIVVPTLVQFHSPKREGDDRIAHVSAPLPTQTTENRFGIAEATLAPFLTEHANASSQRNMPADEPLRTQCAEVKDGHFAVVAPTLIQTGYGERDGQAPRVPGLDKPLGTVVAGGTKHALVAAFMAQHNTGLVGHRMTEPVSTIVGKGCTQALVQTELFASSLVTLRGTDDAHLHGDAIDAPLRTISAGGTHLAEVRAFLCAYFGNEKDGADLFTPMRTVTTRDRFALVTVEGREYVIVDIGMRMLEPRELANAQGFHRDYKLSVPFTSHFTKSGKRRKHPKTAMLSKSAQVRMVGNSVCPPLAAAIVRANFAPERRQEVAA